MQDTLGNILGGLALQLDNSLAIGDWVKVDELSGRVVEIQWRYTAILTRNLGRFASSTADVGEAARLMAMVYVSFADAIGACFEAKYHYQTWRPVSAIQMADADGNDATAHDAAWAPSLPSARPIVFAGPSGKAARRCS